MRLPDPSILGAFYGLSEIILGITRRSGRSASSRDRHSLLLLWGVIFLSIFFSLSVAWSSSTTRFAHPEIWYGIGLGLFVGGIVLRWYAIIWLGRFFTVDVAIAEQHRVIDTGPYRFIRHPSYTGALLAFVGFGLCLGNWLSLPILLLPITAAFMWRIRVEEKALLDALGDDYRDYMRRTKRLIPFVY